MQCKALADPLASDNCEDSEDVANPVHLVHHFYHFDSICFHVNPFVVVFSLCVKITAIQLRFVSKAESCLSLTDRH